jgi:predicted small metal-binding protein
VGSVPELEVWVGNGYLRIKDMRKGVPAMESRTIKNEKEGKELRVSCRDVGVDCDYVAHGRTEEELFKNAAEHGKSAHNMDRIPPEIVEKVRSAIHHQSKA